MNREQIMKNDNQIVITYTVGAKRIQLGMKNYLIAWLLITQFLPSIEVYQRVKFCNKLYIVYDTK